MFKPFDITSSNYRIFFAKPDLDITVHTDPDIEKPSESSYQERMFERLECFESTALPSSPGCREDKVQ